MSNHSSNDKTPHEGRVSHAAYQQRKELQKLFKRVDRPIQIPTLAQEKEYQPPEIVAHVQGSTAGASAGDYHVYRALRKKEMQRLKDWEDGAKKEEAEQVRQEELANKEAREKAKLEKRRKKRMRRKHRNHTDKDADKDSASESDKVDQEQETKEDLPHKQPTKVHIPVIPSTEPLETPPVVALSKKVNNVKIIDEDDF